MSVIFPVNTDPQHWIVLFYFRQENEHSLRPLVRRNHPQITCHSWQ
jgi:hypothetical protein